MRALLSAIVFATLACAAPLSSGAALAQDSHVGNWVWIARSIENPSQVNVSKLIWIDQQKGRYCYNDSCSNVTYSWRGNVFTFTTNNQNLFQFTSPEPYMFIGKFWNKSKTPTGVPDAVIVMSAE